MTLHGFRHCKMSEHSEPTCNLDALSIVTVFIISKVKTGTVGASLKNPLVISAYTANNYKPAV